MDIRQLEYLLEVVHCGSYKKAASHLYITPQAVSKAISDLEQELGLTFFEKRGRALVPTEDVLWFSKQAESLLEQYVSLWNSARLRASNLSQEGNLRIGIASTYRRGTFISDSLFDDMKTRLPNIHVDSLTIPTEACLAALQNGLIDAAISLGRAPEDEYISVPIFRFSPRILVSKTHCLAKKKTVSLGDLHDCPIALPATMHCYAVLRENLFKHGVAAPLFFSIAPSLEAHRDFLNKGGIVFAAKGSEASALIPKTHEACLDSSSSFKITACLIYRKTTSPPACLPSRTTFSTDQRT